MKRALVSVSCLVLAAAATAAGCVDQSDKGAAVPTSEQLCAQNGLGRASKGANLYFFEPINSFEQADRDAHKGEGMLIFDDDETLDNDGTRCAGADADADPAGLTKEPWDQNGDGVVGWFDLAGKNDPLAQCSTLFGAPNTGALNFWGPVYTIKSGVKGVDLPANGYSYSGGTIPLWSGDYQQASIREGVTWDKGFVADASAFEGIAFWARMATAEEGTPVADAINPPNAVNGGAPGVLEAAHAQDGEARLSIMFQTLQTAALDATAWASLELAAKNPETGFAADIPDDPCIDYDTWQCPQPATVATRGEGGSGEVPFRDQCWDGFRTEVEITSQWKFYMLPFSAMRQAGWGRVAEKFNTNQIRSISFSTGAFQAINIVVDEVAFYRKN